MANVTIIEAMGGEPVVRQLVEAFYPKVQADPDLAPIFPEDIRPVMERQFMFLTQFFGGQALYTNAFGHPMMRARHMPFAVTPKRADAWLKCMSRALNEVVEDEQLREVIIDRLRGPAYHFVNTPDDSEQPVEE